MIKYIPSDILLNICYNFTSVKDVNTLFALDKTLYSLGDNIFYLEWGRYTYTKEFWNKAHKRRKVLIKYPYNSMKEELNRIENFQHKLITNNFPRWEIHDFYKYWNALENIVLI